MCPHCSCFSIRLQMASDDTEWQVASLASLTDEQIHFYRSSRSLFNKAFDAKNWGNLTSTFESYVKLASNSEFKEITPHKQFCESLDRISKIIVYKMYELCPKEDNFNRDKQVLFSLFLFFLFT